MARGLLVASLFVGALGCTNSPYPEADSGKKVLYAPFLEAPKTLDPAVGYSTADHDVTENLYDTLLEYHYLKRPFELVGGMAEDVPEPKILDDGRVEYVFRLRPDLLFQDDPCFALSGGKTRVVTADDFVFELRRLADPLVGSPVVDPMSQLTGFVEFGAKLKAARTKDANFAQQSARDQYAAIGGFDGAVATSERELRIRIERPSPQILYWFAMTFTTAMPWEAVQFYDGREGRPDLSEHAVGAGPFMLVTYEKRSRIVLDKNPNWYGVRHPEWKAPGAVFPSTDVETDLSKETLASFAPSSGRSLPLLDRVDYRREEELIPAFSKFLQGYYDLSAVARESFSKVVHEGALSEDMRSRGMRLEKSVTPAVYYIGFNMDDAVIGTEGGERARLLRQAMSLSVDVVEYSRVFMNGRGIPAQSPLPPGLFGYDAGYVNPYRRVDLERAKELLRQAGYDKGIDPKTGRPLRLTFDVPDTSPEQRLRFLFWTNQWRKLGIDVQLAATNYNKFQEKVRVGAYQIFTWGWVADYPDPENFYFLLTTRMARSVSGGVNTANFKHPEFDRIFDEMKSLENGPRREQLLHSLRGILEAERPWIELFHPEAYALTHGFLKNVRPVGISIPVEKYRDVDASARARKRIEWNEPVYWPAWLLVAVVLAVVVPGVLTYRKERQ